MKNEEILKKAIEKTIKSGWHFKEWFTYRFGLEYLSFDEQVDMLAKTENKMLLLFSHSFAKAFFPWVGNEVNEPWVEFLSTMAKQKEPLKYLERFL